MNTRFFLLLMITVLLHAAEGVKSGFVTTSDGVRLHYVEAGSGPAILFIPGWTMPGDIWESQIEHFAKTNRVVAVDPRSQGDSDKPTDGHYPERRAQDYKEVVDQLKLSPVVLVGWSLAVSELLTYVDLFGTSSVRALVLVDGSVGSDPAPQRIPAMWSSFIKPLQTAREQSTRAFVKSMYKKPQSDAYIEKVTKAALKTPTNSTVLLLANVIAPQTDWRQVLPKIDRPVLCVVQSGNKGVAETVKQKVPSARVEIFEDAGHALFVDDADRFNRLLDEFLTKSPGRQP
jgi:non-heme chloroperoxidase